MRHGLFVLAVALVSVFAAPLPSGTASAQAMEDGSITGVVTTSDGFSLPGATVVATMASGEPKYVRVTDADGRYRMESAEVGGPYSVECTLEGFKPQSRDGVYVHVGEPSYVDFELVAAPPGDEAEP